MTSSIRSFGLAVTVFLVSFAATARADLTYTTTVVSASGDTGWTYSSTNSELSFATMGASVDYQFATTNGAQSLTSSDVNLFSVSGMMTQDFPSQMLLTHPITDVQVTITDVVTGDLDTIDISGMGTGTLEKAANRLSTELANTLFLKDTEGNKVTFSGGMSSMTITLGGNQYQVSIPGGFNLGFQGQPGESAEGSLGVNLQVTAAVPAPSSLTLAVSCGVCLGVFYLVGVWRKRKFLTGATVA